MNHPDPKKHQMISFVKSGVRILGCGWSIWTGTVLPLAILLFAAEIIGIYEELV